ncbi:TerD family protein [Streptomyces finlayi]|nr:TerD family protein [Streptomyces finlayi]
MSVRVSSRGVRTSVGPRAARVSFGAGGTRLSTGAGPFSASTSLGGGGGRSRRRTATASPAQTDRLARQAARAEQQAEREAAIAELTRLREETTTVHPEDFAPARPPQLPPPPARDLRWALAEAERHHLTGIGLFSRDRRSAAKQRAAAEVPAYLAAEVASRAHQSHARVETQARDWWARLAANDEETVCRTVNEAFSDNPAAGCAVGVSDGVLSVVVRQPDFGSWPTKTPALTPTGRPTLKNLTQRDRLHWWMTSLGSHVVATLKEGFAVAPGITAIDLAVLTRIPDSRRLGIVVYGQWSRRSVEGTAWRTAEDAVRFLDVGTGVECSVTTSVKALDVSQVPCLAALLGSAEDDAALGDLDAGLTRDGGTPPPAPNPYTPPPPATSPYDPLPYAAWLADRRNPPPPSATALRPGENVALPAPHTALRLHCHSPGADLSVFLLDTAERVARDEDFVFYNQPSGAAGAVHLTPPATVDVALDRLPPSVDRLAVVVSADTPVAARLSVTEPAGGSWEFVTPAASGITALLVAEVYRRGPGVWKLRAVGQGWAEGLAGPARHYGVDLD